LCGHNINQKSVFGGGIYGGHLTNCSIVYEGNITIDMNVPTNLIFCGGVYGGNLTNCSIVYKGNIKIGILNALSNQNFDIVFAGVVCYESINAIEIHNCNIVYNGNIIINGNGAIVSFNGLFGL
jgi:hypothetical protein